MSETHLRSGDPDKEILRTAESLGVGLIVVGSRGLGALSRALFPTGEPPLPGAMPVNGERMELRYAVGVLMDHRDLIRRLAAEAGLAASA